jgi:UTP--glucose-1-phosphate uridylyltransferase
MGSVGKIAPVRKAVVPAAGAGTRMLPVTKAVSKELLPIVDRPLIHYVAEEGALSGIREMIMVTAPGRGDVVDYFRPDRRLEAALRKSKKSYLLESLQDLTRKLRVSAAVQKTPMGLGHAVACARRPVGRDAHFAVILPDDLIDAPTPCLRQMIEWHRRLGGSMVALMEVPLKDVSRYGVAAGTRMGENLIDIQQLVEKPAPARAPSRFAVVGRYILSRRIFQILDSTPKGALGEIQLTDALRRLCHEEKVYGYLFQGTRYDAGNPVGYVRANLAYAAKRPEFLSLFQSEAGGRRAS